MTVRSFACPYCRAQYTYNITRSGAATCGKCRRVFNVR